MFIRHTRVWFPVVHGITGARSPFRALFTIVSYLSGKYLLFCYLVLIDVKLISSDLTFNTFSDKPEISVFLNSMVTRQLREISVLELKVK